MNRWHLSIPVLALSLAGQAHAAMTKGNVFACKDTATLTAEGQLRAKGKATGDFEKAKIAAGDCTSIIKDSVVGIDERKGPLFCVRPSGGLDCYWTVAAGVDEYGKPSQPSAGRGSQGGKTGRRH